MILKPGPIKNNSSSSCLTSEQKDEIIKLVEKYVLNKKTASTKEELDQYFLKTYGEDFTNYRIEFLDDDEQNEDWEEECYLFNKYKQALIAIEKGMTVVTNVDFSEENDEINSIKDIWTIYKKINNFTEID